jgi:hypothetical protein
MARTLASAWAIATLRPPGCKVECGIILTVVSGARPRQPSHSYHCSRTATHVQLGAICFDAAHTPTDCSYALEVAVCRQTIVRKMCREAYLLRDKLGRRRLGTIRMLPLICHGTRGACWDVLIMPAVPVRLSMAVEYAWEHDILNCVTSSFQLVAATF